MRLTVWAFQSVTAAIGQFFWCLASAGLTDAVQRGPLNFRGATGALSVRRPGHTRPGLRGFAKTPDTIVPSEHNTVIPSLPLKIKILGLPLSGGPECRCPWAPAGGRSPRCREGCKSLKPVGLLVGPSTPAP